MQCTFNIQALIYYLASLTKVANLTIWRRRHSNKQLCANRTDICKVGQMICNKLGLMLLGVDQAACKTTVSCAGAFNTIADRTTKEQVSAYRMTSWSVVFLKRYWYSLKGDSFSAHEYPHSFIPFRMNNHETTWGFKLTLCQVMKDAEAWVRSCQSTCVPLYSRQGAMQWWRKMPASWSGIEEAPSSNSKLTTDLSAKPTNMQSQEEEEEVKSASKAAAWPNHDSSTIKAWLEFGPLFPKRWPCNCLETTSGGDDIRWEGQTCTEPKGTSLWLAPFLPIGWGQ